MSENFAAFLKNEPVVRREKVYEIPNDVSKMEIDLQHLEGHKFRYAIPQDGLKVIYVGRGSLFRMA